MQPLQIFTRLVVITILSVLLTACGSSSSDDDTEYEIGDTGPAGGKVFYVFDDGKQGFEAAPEDQSTGAPWGCMAMNLAGADGTDFGTGEQNTADILAGCADTPIAADIAAGYMLIGYTDWFLPSKVELRALYFNQDAVGGFTCEPSCNYWSSSEFNDSEAWIRDFRFGAEFSPSKDTLYRVRAIRAF